MGRIFVIPEDLEAVWLLDLGKKFLSLGTYLLTLNPNPNPKDITQKRDFSPFAPIQKIVSCIKWVPDPQIWRDLKMSSDLNIKNIYIEFHAKKIFHHAKFL